ncbi:MAG: hypothetical protein DI535_03890 [Citrobacter freundii]|nr:MAG: hypothetical protein DI535_03890 [Citrobacter freundii]
MAAYIRSQVLIFYVMRMFFWVSTYFLDRKLSPDTRVELIEQLSLQALKVVIADSLRVDNNYFA